MRRPVFARQSGNSKSGMIWSINCREETRGGLAVMSGSARRKGESLNCPSAGGGGVMISTCTEYCTFTELLRYFVLRRRAPEGLRLGRPDTISVRIW